MRYICTCACQQNISNLASKPTRNKTSQTLNKRLSAHEKTSLQWIERLSVFLSRPADMGKSTILVVSQMLRMKASSKEMFCFKHVSLCEGTRAIHKNQLRFSSSSQVLTAKVATIVLGTSLWQRHQWLSNCHKKQMTLRPAIKSFQRPTATTTAYSSVKPTRWLNLVSQSFKTGSSTLLPNIWVFPSQMATSPIVASTSPQLFASTAPSVKWAQAFQARLQQVVQVYPWWLYQATS